MSQTPSQMIHLVRFPNESPQYRASRNKLLEAEMALRRQTEDVAAMRRALPAGGRIPQDYVFTEGEDEKPVRLSELFGDKSVLFLYSYMYGPAMKQPCPSCTSILDGLDGQAPHIAQLVAIAAVARSPIGRFRAVAEERGWRHLRLPITMARMQTGANCPSSTCSSAGRTVTSTMPMQPSSCLRRTSLARTPGMSMRSGLFGALWTFRRTGAVRTRTQSSAMPRATRPRAIAAPKS
jgi:hypothetical protein